MSAKDCDIVGLVVGCIDDREKGPATKTMSACPKLQSDAAELREILSLLREEEHPHPSNLTQRTLARLEQDRLRVALHHVPVKIVDRIDQRVELQIPSHPPRRLKILRHAFPQIARLADVDHRAEPVLVQIHARLVRHLRKLVPDVFAVRHRASF